MTFTQKPLPTSRQPRKGSFHEKILPIDQIGTLAAQARAEGRKVVLAHGVFDLIHVGHLRHLQEAASLGDILVVTTTEDEHVNKGPGRPVFSEQLRTEMLAALEIVNYVGISRHPSAENVIGSIRPDIYVKGPDYENAADDITGKISAEQHAASSSPMM
jgi:rfaE bifunctional protein nucleotidyltransferase chain/domain